MPIQTKRLNFLAEEINEKLSRDAGQDTDIETLTNKLKSIRSVSQLFISTSTIQTYGKMGTITVIYEDTLQLSEDGPSPTIGDFVIDAQKVLMRIKSERKIINYSSGHYVYDIEKLYELSPVKGRDYLTQQDIDAIVAKVNQSLVDVSNNAQ